MKYRQLSLEERCTLTALRREGFGIVAISERLGRHRSTLWRELLRNRSRHDGFQARFFSLRATTRLFFTENTLGTWFARKLARFLSISLSTMPSSVTLPFFTMM